MTEEREDRELEEKPDGDVTLEEWSEGVKSGIEEIVGTLPPEGDVNRMLHVETSIGAVVAPMPGDDKAAQAAGMAYLLDLIGAERAAFIDATWARIADEDNPLTEREQQAYKDGTFAASVSPDRIEMVTAVVGERRPGKEARLGILMARIERHKDSHPTLVWEEKYQAFESDDDNSSRAEGRFPDAIRMGLS